MKWNKLYNYPPSTRSTTDGLRTYDVGKEKLPSVTTILSATQPQEKRDSIAQWQAKVGEEQATRIKEQAAARGTDMHTHLEKHILGEGYLDLRPEGRVAKLMAEGEMEGNKEQHRDYFTQFPKCLGYSDVPYDKFTKNLKQLLD